jgi:hypothetical protein
LLFRHFPTSFEATLIIAPSPLEGKIPLNEQNKLQLIKITVEPYFIGLWFNVVDIIAYGNQVDHVWLILLLDYGGRH